MLVPYLDTFSPGPHRIIAPHPLHGVHELVHKDVLPVISVLPVAHDVLCGSGSGGYRNSPTQAPAQVVIGWTSVVHAIAAFPQ